MGEMACIHCKELLPVPEDVLADVRCPGCGQVFVPWEDLGWWGYSAVVYVPERFRRKR